MKLLKDKDGNYSLGRVLILILFILALKFWYFGNDIPATMSSTLMALLLYEMGKKGRDAYMNVQGRHYSRRAMNSTSANTVGSEPS